MGCLLYRCMTQAPSHKTSTGQTRAQLAPRILASRMVRAEPERLPLAIFLINRGTSICVGHAAAQGASKQKRHRLASGNAACRSSGGCRSGKRAAVSGWTGACCTKDVWPLMRRYPLPVYLLGNHHYALSECKKSIETGKETVP